MNLLPLPFSAGLRGIEQGVCSPDRAAVFGVKHRDDLVSRAVVEGDDVPDIAVSLSLPRFATLEYVTTVASLR